MTSETLAQLLCYIGHYYHNIIYLGSLRHETKAVTPNTVASTKHDGPCTLCQFPPPLPHTYSHTPRLFSNRHGGLSLAQFNVRQNVTFYFPAWQSLK